MGCLTTTMLCVMNHSVKDMLHPSALYLNRGSSTNVASSMSLLTTPELRVNSHLFISGFQKTIVGFNCLSFVAASRYSD